MATAVQTQSPASPTAQVHLPPHTTEDDRLLAVKRVKSLQRRDAGISALLREEYGLVDHQLHDISIDARAGFDDDAVTSLLKALSRKRSSS